MTQRCASGRREDECGKHSSLVGLSLAAVLTVIPLSAASAAPVEPDTPARAGRIDAAGRTPTLFTGVATYPDGTPVEGADVVLVAWPDTEALSSVAPGETVDAVAIGQTVTDEEGQFAVAADRKALAGWYGKKARGQVQVEVSVTAPGYFSSWDATLDYSPELGRVVALPDSGATDAELLSTSTAPSQALKMTMQAADPNAPVDAELMGGAPQGDVSTAAVIGYSCYRYISDMGRRAVTVGQLGAQTTSYVGQYTYTSGVVNTVGAGTSASGAAGSWSASGTRTITSSSSLGFPAVSTTGTTSFRTEAKFGKYHGTGCSPSSVFYYKFYPSEWIGSVITSRSSISPSATYCATVSNQGSLTQLRSKATTVSGGLSSAGAIGINLTSQAGWTNSAKMKITLRKNGSVCGTSGYPGSTTSNPGRLVVK